MDDFDLGKGKRDIANRQREDLNHPVSSVENDRGRRPVLTIVRRAGLALLIMIFLVISASGISLWFAGRVQQTVYAMRVATEQAIQVSNLQLRWLTIAGALDTFSVTRPTPETRAEIDRQISELNEMLYLLTSQPLGLSTEKIAENQLIAEDLKQTGLEMTSLVKQLYDLVEQGRWGTALQKRQSMMAGMQTNLIDNLDQLNANLQSDVSAQVAEIARLQELARTFSLIAIGTSVLFAIIAIWITRRTVLTPINQLIRDIQQVSKARMAEELEPIEPMTQRDEIGDLSRAMSRMVGWLRESYGLLEEQVAERTRRLQRRTVQLEVAAQVARDIAAARDLESLLYRAVNTIRDRFGFYHAGIFLIDQRQEYAILRAATGEAGRELLRQKHQLKVGRVGVVGYVAESGERRVASDVGKDQVHFRNPLLPETRSEAALPLAVASVEQQEQRGVKNIRVIGVLDVQSEQTDAFDEESLATLQIVADQLAIAIQNARLFEESQESMRELEATYRQINQQAWQRMLHTNRVIGYQYDGIDATPIYKTSLPAEENPKEDVSSKKPFQIPLRVRGEVIGSLDVWLENDEQGEAPSEADVFLLASISNRLSQTLESARLYEDAQRLAWREQQINLVSSQVRNSVNLETILQNTVRELGKSLGASRAYIQIGGEYKDGQDEASQLISENELLQPEEEEA